MHIRRATNTDYDAVWHIFSDVIHTGDTYVFHPNSPKGDLQKHWFADYMQTYVVEDQGEVLGTYIIKRNQIDLGDHIANCSYMILPAAQGRGLGKLLCQHSIDTAKDLGFTAIQFNIVVSTNTNAIKLWERFGFEIIGTTPNGFRHATLGLVDTHIMYKALT